MEQMQHLLFFCRSAEGNELIEIEDKWEQARTWYADDHPQDLPGHGDPYHTNHGTPHAHFVALAPSFANDTGPHAPIAGSP